MNQGEARQGPSMVARPRWSTRCPSRRFTTGRPCGEGVVHVFDLEGHPKATRAYAWSSPIEGSDNKRRFYAVLHLGGIRSPLDAVRAAIVAERRSQARLWELMPHFRVEAAKVVATGKWPAEL